MADMYGAVRSNWFKVKDSAAFRAWFESRVRFGSEIEVWSEGYDGRTGADVVAFGGYEQYPSAYPMMPGEPDVQKRIEELHAIATDESIDPNARTHANNELENLQLDPEFYMPENAEWDLDAFAAEFRAHLAEPQDVQVIAAGHEKLRYVGCSALFIPKEGKPVFLTVYSDNDTALEDIRKNVCG
jgi:hypothetical protein